MRMLRIPDMGAIRNPEAYLYTVASNLAKEHAHQERRDRAALDVDDPVVQEQLAELPSFGGELDSEQRIRRLREVLEQLSPKCRAAVELPYWHGLQLRGDRAAARGLDEHGQEVPEPGAGALPPPHGAAGVRRMSANDERVRELVVAAGGGLVRRQPRRTLGPGARGLRGLAQGLARTRRGIPRALRASPRSARGRRPPRELDRAIVARARRPRKHSPARPRVAAIPAAFLPPLVAARPRSPSQHSPS